MRNSINYNLKYFIMKMSSTKPMKNTMRKQSPLKFMGTNAAMEVTKKISGAVDASAKKAKSAKAAAAPKLKNQAADMSPGKTSAAAPKGKTNAGVKPTPKKISPSRAALIKKVVATGKNRMAKESASTPAMQMKKSGMGKKC